VFWLGHADASAASMGTGALGVRKMTESAQNRLSGEGNTRSHGRAPSKVASNAPKEGTATTKFVTRDNAASAVR
jgi:hypothetical protein